MQRTIYLYGIGSAICLLLLILITLLRAVIWHQSYVSAQATLVESASTTPVEVALISNEATSSTALLEDAISKQASSTQAAKTKAVAASKVRSPVLRTSFADSLPTIDQIKDILAYIANCESENNPLAKNKNSSAKGLLQIIDGTWETYSCEGNPYNGADNMNCGIRIALQSSSFSAWNESKACWAKRLPDELAIHTY